MPLPKEIDRHLKGEFKHGLCGSIARSPLSCLSFHFCTPCALFTQRRQILGIAGEPYVMCGGLWPCCGFQSPIPDVCLVCEVCMCPGAALAGNRFLVQTRLDLKNTTVDNCLRVFQCCVTCEFACLRLCCECSQERENLVKSGVCVCPTTHCQNSAALRDFERGSGDYKGPPSSLLKVLPNHFFNAGVSPAIPPIQMQPLP